MPIFFSVVTQVEGTRGYNTFPFESLSVPGDGWTQCQNTDSSASANGSSRMLCRACYLGGWFLRRTLSEDGGTSVVIFHLPGVAIADSNEIYDHVNNC